MMNFSINNSTMTQINSLIIDKSISINKKKKKNNNIITFSAAVNNNSTNFFDKISTVTLNFFGIKSSDDYLNKNDIQRYKEIQCSWADDFSKRFDIPQDNIKARLPQIHLAKAKSTVKNYAYGFFDSRENKILLNPIKEIMKDCEEIVVVHESMHGYLANLRQAYLVNKSEDVVQKDIQDIVLDFVKNGETNKIYAGTFEQEKLFIKPPLFSNKERNAVCDFIKNIDSECVEVDKSGLTTLGYKKLVDKLIPQLNDLSLQYDLKTEKLDLISDVFKYVNSFYARCEMVKKELISSRNKKMNTNLDTPVSVSEKKLAKESLKGLLSTLQGNMYISIHSDEIAKSMYFTSYEENFANKEAIVFQLNKLNSKINVICAKGLTPAKNLIVKQKKLKDNLEILNLSKKIADLELQMASEPINLVHVQRLKKVLKYKSSVFENEYLLSAMKIAQELKLDIPKNKKFDELKLIKKHLSDFQFNAYKGYLTLFLKGNPILTKMHNSFYTMKISPKTLQLRLEYKDTIKKIQKVMIKSLIASAPKQYFQSIKHFEANSKLRGKTTLFKKWIQKLHL